MFTKTQGVVGRGWGWQKIGIELGFDAFYPDFIPTGDVPNFVLCLVLLIPKGIKFVYKTVVKRMRCMLLIIFRSHTYQNFISVIHEKLRKERKKKDLKK